MDEQQRPIESRIRARRLRVVVLLMILLFSSSIILRRLGSSFIPVVDEQQAVQSVEFDDPMIPLEVDLIPWQSDESRDEQVAHTQDNQPQSGGVQNHRAGRVLIVRGILTIFSLGMDDLAEKLRKAGYEVKVTTAAQSKYEARSLRDHVFKTQSKKPIVIIGHSLGGDLAPRLARVFAEKDIPVDVLFMLDSTMPSSPPDNVKVCVNMYQNNGTPDWARIFRGKRIDAHSSNTRLINVDIRKLAGKDTTSRINHFNIDANPWIHKVVINMIGQLLPDSHVKTPTTTQKTTGPIRRASQIPAQPQRQPQRRN